VKLSKNNLRRALFALADEMIDGSSEFAEKAINALNDDTLEIEGYTRDKWTRFDPKDPKTFPPKGDFLGYFDHGGINDFQHVCIRDDEDTDEALATQAIFPHLKYWRPLPQPPGKEEM
jgi:hypothetical protein